MRRNYDSTPDGRPCDRQHVQDEGVITATLRRHVRGEARIGVGKGVPFPNRCCPPLVEAERRIGDHHVEPHQVIAFDQRRRVEGVAPVDARTVLGMQKHVEPRERSRAAVRLLAEKLEIAVGHFLTRAQQQRRRATGWITNPSPDFGLASLATTSDTLRGVKNSPAFLPAIGRKTLDQEDVGIAEDIF